MSNTETKTIYRQLGISEDVWIYGQKIEEGLKLVIKTEYRDIDAAQCSEHAV